LGRRRLPRGPFYSTARRRTRDTKRFASAGENRPQQSAPIKSSEQILNSAAGSVSMPSQLYSRKVTRAERFGMIVGGGALIAVLSSQVLFVAWVAGLGW
jgi:hypothetical protein